MLTRAVFLSFRVGVAKSAEQANIIMILGSLGRTSTLPRRKQDE